MLPVHKVSLLKIVPAIQQTLFHMFTQTGVLLSFDPQSEHAERPPPQVPIYTLVMLSKYLLI